MDLISIIIPVYRIEEYLDRCVESVTKQTYTYLEILLVDDGSPDRCPRMCEEWAEKDSRIKVIHQKNRGLSVARNTGIAQACGKYIMFVDGDDYIAPDMVKALYNTVIATGAEIALCNFEKGANSNFKFCDYMDEPEIIEPKIAFTRMYEDSQSSFRYVTAWGKLYQCSLFGDIRYPEGKIFEDMYVTHQLIDKCEKIAIVNQKMYYYFQRSDSIVNRGYDKKKLDYLEALKERVFFFEKHGYTDLKDIAYDEYIHSLIWEYSRVRDILHDKKVKKELAKKFRTAYKRGYSSKRYASDNALYLFGFYLNPELIVLYWKVNGKWKSLFKKRGKNESSIS